VAFVVVDFPEQKGYSVVVRKPYLKMSVRNPDQFPNLVYSAKIFVS